MNESNPDDIRFPIETATAITNDLVKEAFEKGKARSQEYQNGFRDGALDRLAEGRANEPIFRPPYKEGTCQFDAWDAGRNEGDTAACAFQLVYMEDNGLF